MWPFFSVHLFCPIDAEILLAFSVPLSCGRIYFIHISNEKSQRSLSWFLFCFFLTSRCAFVDKNAEILEYAAKIGIDPEKETNLIYLARQGLLHPLPENWKPW